MMHNEGGNAWKEFQDMNNQITMINVSSRCRIS